MGYKHSDCDKDTIIHQLLKMQAQVRSTPCIKHGKPKVYCLYSKLKPDSKCCECTESETDTEREAEIGTLTDKCGDNCCFTLTQIFCVQIPLKFAIDIDLAQGIVCCGEPAFGPCKPKCKTCNSEKADIKDEIENTEFADITDEIELTDE